MDGEPKPYTLNPQPYIRNSQVLDGERAIAIKGSHVQGSHVPKAAQGTNSGKCSLVYWFYTVDIY